MFGNVGMVLSFVIALTAISTSIPRADALSIFVGTTIGGLSKSVDLMFMNGLHAAFIASAAMLVLAMAMSAFRGKENRAKISKEKMLEKQVA